MEVWVPGQHRRAQPGEAADPTSIDAVVAKACRLAVGVHATNATRAWRTRAVVSPLVLCSDLCVLPADDISDMAHLRFAERSTQADTEAAALRAHDQEAAEYESRIGAAQSPDYMGAAIRSMLTSADG
jgi:hypothetical protein